VALLASALGNQAARVEAEPHCPDRTSDLPRPGLRPSDWRLRARRLVVVRKAARRLCLYRSGALAASYPVALAPRAPAGDKREEGDRRTPEGWYRTSDKPWSSFDGAIAIDYPSLRDARRGMSDDTIGRRAYEAIRDAHAAGAMPPQHTAMGGHILIHGGGASSDWTAGCIALEDEDLAVLRDALGPAQRAHLFIAP
jgi:murein L,D-transpeptidase YafK